MLGQLLTIHSPFKSRRRYLSASVARLAAYYSQSVHFSNVLNHENGGNDDGGSPSEQRQHQVPSRLVTQARQHILKASAAGDLALCLSLLENHCAQTEGLTGSKSGQLFAEAMRHLPPTAALQAYHLARRRQVRPTPGMAVSVIRMYAALGMLRHVEGVVRDLGRAGLPPHWSVYFHWADVHAEAGEPDGVSAAAAAAAAAGLEVTAHYQTMTIKALCKSGKIYRTLGLLQSWKEGGNVPPEPVWRALIHCHGTAGYARRAQSLFDEMRSFGVEAGLETWTALVNAYAECRMTREALATASEMRKAGIRGNTQFYTVLLKACMHAGDVNTAQAAVEQMRRDGVEPTIHVWGALISSCALAGNAAAARAAFSSMIDSGCPPGIIQYTCLLTAHRYAGDLTGGLQVLKDMDAAGVRPTGEFFTEVIMMLGLHGLITEAEEAFAAMRSQGIAPDQIAYNVMLDVLLANWVDLHARDALSPLLLRADELFKEGWSAGTTRPRMEFSSGRSLILVDLHRQGLWSGQLAVLAAMADACTAFSSATPSGSDSKVPALILITGQGLKTGRAPLRDTVSQLLQRMGLRAKVAAANEGMYVVTAVEMKKVARMHAQGVLNAIGGHRYLVDPRKFSGGDNGLQSNLKRQVDNVQQTASAVE